ncbi:group II intron reverse transcriptase/maturase [Deltaproteobacteria bacterium TL4]
MNHLKTSETSLSRDDVLQREIKRALNEDLFEKMLSAENMSKAWKQVKSNKGSAGIDGMTIDEFPSFAKQHWRQILASLRDGSYHPQPVLRVSIDKPDGGKRDLGIPAITERVIMQAIAQVLTPLFDPGFSEYSFGFRPNRSAKMGVEQVRDYIKEGYKIAVDMDLSKFFDRVNHDILMTRLGQTIRDKRLLRLIGLFLRAGVMIDNQFAKTHQGVPQGSPLSPILSNIVLDELDKELEKRGHRFARYADDSIVLVKSLRAGKRVLASITQFVEGKLKLKINEEKSQVVPVNKSKFLGFTFNRGKIAWHPKTVEAFKRKVRRLTNRNWGISMEVQIAKLSQYLRGWGNYFTIANTYQRCVDLDHWIRRRIRMCYWNQWRKPRTKIRNLLRRGVPLKMAIDCGITSKGPWRSSKTQGIQHGLSNKYLADQGLVSLRDIWIATHYG